MPIFFRVFSKTGLILFTAFFLLIIIQSSDCFGIETYPLREDATRILEWWKKKVSAYMEPERRERAKKNISWIGKFDEKEKREILAFVEKSNFGIFPSLKILKTDLENDGNSDYVMNELFIRNPKPYHYGAAFVVLTSKKNQFYLKVLSLSGYTRLRSGNLFSVEDLDGDGFKELIVGWEDDGDDSEDDPSSDNFRNIIYKDDRGFLWPVYERKTHAYLRITDLDDNGIPEILETVDESKEGTYTPYTKWRWINVYNLIGSSIEQTNHKYLNFYKGKKKEYEALKKEAREKEIEAQRLGELCPGCEHSAYFYLEQVMDEYIERINKMIKDDLTGK